MEHVGNPGHHDDDDDDQPSEVALRVKALESLLVEKGLVDRKRCSVTLGLSALQDGWSGCQFHGISSSMRF